MRALLETIVELVVCRSCANSEHLIAFQGLLKVMLSLLEDALSSACVFSKDQSSSNVKSFSFLHDHGSNIFDRDQLMRLLERV